MPLAKSGGSHSSIADAYESRGSFKQAAPLQSQSRNSSPEPRELRASVQALSLENLAELVQEHSKQLAQLRAQHEALRVEADNFRRCLSSIRGVDQSPNGGKFQTLASSGARSSARTQPDQLSRGVGKLQQRQRQSTPQAFAFGGRVPMRASETAASTSSTASKVANRFGRSSLPATPSTVALRPRVSMSSSSSSSVQRGRADSSPGVKALKSQRSRSSSSGGLTDECIESGDVAPRRRHTESRSSKIRGSLASETHQDLYDYAQPLLEPTSSAHQQTCALQAVEAALKRGAAPSSWQGPGTPLRTAVEARQVALVRVLLKAHANPDDCDERAVSVLHAAAFHGQQDLCSELLQAKANANAADQHGQTPLFFAPTRSICELLCSRRADTHATNLKGQSAVHFAGQAALSDVLLWFATRVNRAVLDLHDVHGATAAYYARAAGVKSEVLSKLQQGEQSGMQGFCRKTGAGRTSEVLHPLDPGLETTRVQLDLASAGNSGALPPLPEELSLDLDAGTLDGRDDRARTGMTPDNEADTPTSGSACSPFLSQFAFEDTAEDMAAEHMAAVQIQTAARSYLARRHCMCEESRGCKEDKQQIEVDSMTRNRNDVSAPEVNVSQCMVPGPRRFSARSRVLRRVQSESCTGTINAAQKLVSLEKDTLPGSGDEDCGPVQPLGSPPKSKTNPPRSLPGTPRRDRPPNQRRSSTTSPPPVTLKQSSSPFGHVQSLRTLRTRSTTSTSTTSCSPGNSPQRSKIQPASTPSSNRHSTTQQAPLPRSGASKSPSSWNTSASLPCQASTSGRSGEFKARK